jgi:hypothetical protein
MQVINAKFTMNGKIVTTLDLGLRLRLGLTRVWAKNEVRESHFMLLGVQKSVRE